MFKLCNRTASLSALSLAVSLLLFSPLRAEGKGNSFPNTSYGMAKKDTTLTGQWKKVLPSLSTLPKYLDDPKVNEGENKGERGKYGLKENRSLGEMYTDLLKRYFRVLKKGFGQK